MITTALENDKCTVVIADSGVGIAKENLPKVVRTFLLDQGPLPVFEGCGKAASARE